MSHRSTCTYASVMHTGFTLYQNSDSSPWFHFGEVEDLTGRQIWWVGQVLIVLTRQEKSSFSSCARIRVYRWSVSAEYSPLETSESYSVGSRTHWYKFTVYNLINVTKRKKRASCSMGLETVDSSTENCWVLAKDTALITTNDPQHGSWASLRH